MDLLQRLAPPSGAVPTITVSLPSVAVVVVLVSVFTMGYIKYGRAKMQNVQAELRLRRLNAETMQLIDTKVPKAATPGRKGIVEDDGSWSSLLWSLSIYTDTSIRIKKMVLKRDGDRPKSKALELIGGASSVVALKDWIARMLVKMPAYDFIVVSQKRFIGESNFPIGFKVTARNQ